MGVMSQVEKTERTRLFREVNRAGVYIGDAVLRISLVINVVLHSGFLYVVFYSRG